MSTAAAQSSTNSEQLPVSHEVRQINIALREINKVELWLILLQLKYYFSFVHLFLKPSLLIDSSLYHFDETTGK